MVPLSRLSFLISRQLAFLIPKGSLLKNSLHCLVPQIVLTVFENVKRHLAKGNILKRKQ